MRKLATRAEVAVTTLYNLYGGRGEILLAIVNEAADAIILALDAESTLDDPIERCFSIFEVTVREFGRNESTHRPMIVAGFGPQSLQVNADRRIAGRAIAVQREAIEAARDYGLLRPEADAMRLAEQMFHGWDLACAQWAHGRIDLAAFEARSLYGVVLALQALASDELQPTLEARRVELEQRLAEEH